MGEGVIHYGSSLHGLVIKLNGLPFPQVIPRGGLMSDAEMWDMNASFHHTFPQFLNEFDRTLYSFSHYLGMDGFYQLPAYAAEQIAAVLK
jgi:hypothetical protein